MSMVIKMSRTKGKRFADKKTAKELKKQRKEKENNITAYTSQSSNTYETSINSESKSKKEKKHHFFFNFIIILCVAAIIFSSYNIVLWFIDNYKSKKMIDDIYNNVNITEETISLDDLQFTKRHYDLKKLLAQNTDTVGWIYVKGTNIDYPVVQTTDNDYYLNHSFDRSSNSAGWIFADYRCDATNNCLNTVMYGHNRKDASMFGSLQRVLGEEWYSNEENLYINYSTLNETHIYRVFSTFVCNDADVEAYTQTHFSNKEDFLKYVQTLKKHSSHDFGTDTSQAQQIITLYTCYGLNNQRLLVCAVLVK